MTAAAFLDQEQESADSFLDQEMESADSFLDAPATAMPQPGPVPSSVPEPQRKPEPLKFSGMEDPVRILGDNVHFDPDRFSEGVKFAWENQLIDAAQYAQLKPAADEFAALREERQALEARAGVGSEGKAFLRGVGRGSAMTAGAVGLGAMGAGAGAATGPAAPVASPVFAGLGAIVGAVGAGKAYDKVTEALADNDAEFDSYLAAAELNPGWSTAGELTSLAIPAVGGVRALALGARNVAADRGAGAAAQFVGKVGGVGAGTGAAFDPAARAMERANNPEQSPAEVLVEGEREQIPIFDAAGILTSAGAGLLMSGVSVGNRRFSQRDVQDIIAKPPQARTKAESEVAARAQSMAEQITAEFGTGTRGRNLQLDQTTFMGQPQATTARADITVPQSGTAAITGRPGAMAPAVRSNPAAPVQPGPPAAYTGQNFVTPRSGSPGPVRQPITPGAESALTYQPFAALLPATASAPAATTPRPVTQSSNLPEDKYPVIDFEVDRITLSDDVPNFKRNAGPDGVVDGNRLQGTYRRLPKNPITIWERNTGAFEIITGRHRLDLAKRSGEKTIPSQILREADGFSQQDALTFDAEVNIQDGQGTIQDYANYFRNSAITEAEARQGSLLSRTPQRSGFAIGKGAGDDLYAAYQAGRIAENKAVAIAQAAPGNDAIQRAGLKHAAKLKADELPGFLAYLVQQAGPKAEQVDLFGSDDSAITTSVRLARDAASKARDIGEQIAAVKGAAKRPEQAAKLGVDVRDPEGLTRRIAELQALQARYQNFYRDPEILAELKGEPITPVNPAPPARTIDTQGEGVLIPESEMPFNLAGETDISAQQSRIAAEEQAAIERTKAIAETQDRDQTQMFGGSGFADAGPVGAPRPATPPPGVKPTDASIYNAGFADAPLASKGPGWTMPVTLGATDKVRPLEVPELIELVKLLTGTIPDLKKFPKALGMFYPMGKGKISINPKIAGDYQSLAMTLAHEIGHAQDFMDDRTMKRGNILGRIGSLTSYLKTTLDLTPTSPSLALTSKDRQELRRQAESETGPKPPKDEGQEEWREAVSTRYRELIAEAITDRKLTTTQAIREELITLSDWWKPYLGAPGMPESYLSYRESSPELYADAVSVLLNSPADLESRAPTFWKMMWSYLDRKPTVKQSLLDIQALLNKGHDAVVDARLDRDRAARVKGAEIFMRKDAEARDRRARLTGWWDTLLDQYWDKYFPANQAIGQAVKAGRMTSAQQDAFRYLAEEHPLGDSRLMMNLADIGRMYQSLAAAGVPQLELGGYLKYDRIVNERYDVMEKIKGAWEITGESGRSTMANPGGENPKTSQDALDRMQATLGPAAFAELRAGAETLRRIMHEVNTEAWDSGLYTPQQWDLLQSNADSYATFTALEYVERYMPAGIKKQVGTFKDIADPAQQTILKMIAIHRAAQQNRFTIGAINAIRQAVPEAITDAPMVFDGKRQVPQRPRDRELELVEWKEQGVRKGAHVQKRFAAMMDKSPAEQDALLRLLHSSFTNTMYNFIIRYNPAFQMAISPLRDNQRSLVNTPGGVKGKLAYFKRTAQELAALTGSAQGRQAIATTGVGWAGMTAGAATGALFGGPVGGLAGTIIGGYAGSGLGRLLAEAINYLPLPDNPTAATDWASGDFGRNALLREMVDHYAIGSPWSTFGGRNTTSDDAISQLLRSYNLQDQKTRGAFMDALMYPLHAIEFAGQTLQALVKVSGYRVMTEDLGIDGKESGAYVRSHFGLPNTSKAGAHVRQAGALTPFLNVFLRSYDSLGRLATGNESKMSSKEWVLSWLLGGSGLLVIMQTLAREGVLGEDLQRMYERVPSGDLTNYIVAPLGETQTGDYGGKTAYVRLPQDEGMRVINGTVHKALTLAIRGVKSTMGQETPAGANLSDLLAPGAGVMPGINPMAEIAVGWSEFVQNRNPIDNFRRTPVVSSDAFDAGGLPALTEMTGWTLNKSGLTNFYSYDRRADTSIELGISMTPILNRLVRVSDAGLREQQNAEERADDIDLKRIRTELGGSTKGLRREYMTLRRIDSERRTDRQNQRYELLNLWYNRKYRSTLRDVEYWLEMDDKSEARRLVRDLEETSKQFDRNAN